MMGEEKKMTINVETRNYFIYCIYAGGFVRKRTREREQKCPENHCSPHENANNEKKGKKTQEIIYKIDTLNHVP
jgi:hypothetical protein